MKKKRIAIGIAIALVAVIALLEVFNWHPGFAIGRYQIRWEGVRHMRFHSVKVTNTIGDRQERLTIHIFGPITIVAKQD